MEMGKKTILNLMAMFLMEKNETNMDPIYGSVNEPFGLILSSIFSSGS